MASLAGHEYLEVFEDRGREFDAGLPALGSRALVGVTLVEIAALLEQVNMGTSPAVADRVRATLGEPFADAVEERLVDRSPVPERVP